MKTRRSLLLLTTLGGFALAAPLPAPAQTATPNPTATPSKDRTGAGDFRTSDGTTGTFTETFTVVGNVSTDTVTYTATTTATSTVTTVTTINADGSRLVVYTDLDFGAAVPFTSTTTFAAPAAATTNHVKGGAGSIGTGTYTAADDTTGTLVSLATRDGQDNITSTDYTSAAGVLTRELRLVTQGPGSTTVRTLIATAANGLSSTSITRFSGEHHDHH